MKKLEPYILIAGFFLCGLFSSRQVLDVTLSPRHIIWCAVTLVLFISISYRAIKEPASVDLGFIKSLLFVAFAGFVFCSIASLVFAANASETVYGTLRAFLTMVYVFCAVIIIRENTHLFIKSITVLGLILAGYGLYQYCTLEFRFRVGTMSGRNLWSAAQFLLLPFCVYSLLKFKRAWKVIAAIAIALTMFNIVTLLTRSVWLALFVAVFLSLSFRPKYLLYGVIIVALLSCSVYLARNQSAPAGTLVKRATDLKSPIERFQMWNSTLNIIKDYPIYGIGAGNWRIIIPKYGRGIVPPSGAMAFKNVYYQRPHNDNLWVLCETGAFGFVCYSLIFISALFYLYKRRSHIALMVFFGLIGYMCFAFFSFPKERAFHSMILCILLALSVANYKRKPLYLKTQKIYALSLLVLAVLSFAMVDFCLRYHGESIVRTVIVERRLKRWRNALNALEGRTWFYSLDPISTPLLWYKGELNYLTNNIEQAVIDFDRANEKNPNHVFVLTNLGACLALTGRSEESVPYLEYALKLCPEFEGAKNNLKEVYAKIKK